MSVVSLLPIPGCDETKPLQRWRVLESAQLVEREMGGLDCRDPDCTRRHPIAPTYTPPVFAPRRVHEYGGPL